MTRPQQNVAIADMKHSSTRLTHSIAQLDLSFCQLLLSIAQLTTSFGPLASSIAQPNDPATKLNAPADQPTKTFITLRFNEHRFIDVIQSHTLSFQ